MRVSRPTKRERLAAALRAKGFDVEAEDIILPLGHWRSSPYADVKRWHANARGGSQFPNCPRLSVHISSWDTITDCLRYGFTITCEAQLCAGAHTSFEVDARRPPRDE